MKKDMRHDLFTVDLSQDQVDVLLNLTSNEVSRVEDEIHTHYIDAIKNGGNLKNEARENDLVYFRNLRTLLYGHKAFKSSFDIYR